MRLLLRAQHDDQGQADANEDEEELSLLLRVMTFGELQSRALWGNTLPT